MADDPDSDISFSSRSKDKHLCVTMLQQTLDIPADEEDNLTHRSTRAPVSNRRMSTDKGSRSELFYLAKALKKELQLHEAVIKNDADAVKRVLREPLDVNSRNNYGRAPIHWASSRGNTEIMEMLISAKCDIEAKDKYGMRPILMAAWHGHKDAVQMLINCGANVVAVNKKQYTLLMCASRNNRSEVVDFLLDTLEDIKVDAVDLEQQTALYHAALGGHIGVVRRLVEAGAKTDTRNKQGRTPLHAACEKGHMEVAEFLLRHEANLDARDEDGNCPLHTATENQQTQVVQLLLDNGGHPDAENTKGFTPLHVASNKGCRGIMEALVQHGASLNHQSKNGNTPLHVACQANETETVELLISKGTDLNVLNVRLQSPIHIAAEQGYTDICKLLLAAGANIDQREQGGKTPLYIAARGSFTAIVDMIIKTARLDYPAPVRSPHPAACACRTPSHPNTTPARPTGSDTARVEEEEGAENNLNVLNTARRKWRLSESRGSTAGTMQHDANERLRELLFRVAYKQLAQGEWKRLAYHWAFTEEQIKAIEHQYTGPSSYKEHGFRMLLIWVHGLGPEVNPVKELYESLAAIGKKSVADALRKKLDEENEGKYKKGKRRCNACSIT